MASCILSLPDPRCDHMRYCHHFSGSIFSTSFVCNLVTFKSFLNLVDQPNFAEMLIQWPSTKYMFFSPLPAKAEGDYSFRFRLSVRHIKILSFPDCFLTSFDILT